MICPTSEDIRSGREGSMCEVDPGHHRERSMTAMVHAITQGVCAAPASASFRHVISLSSTVAICGPLLAQHRKLSWDSGITRQRIVLWPDWILVKNIQRSKNSLPLEDGPTATFISRGRRKAVHRR